MGVTLDVAKYTPLFKVSLRVKCSCYQHVGYLDLYFYFLSAYQETGGKSWALGRFSTATVS